VLFNPLLPEFRADPYATFHRLRTEAPVAWSSAPVPGFWGFWFVSRYEDVMTGLKDKRFGREVDRVMPPGTLPPAPEAHRPLLEMIRKWMLFKDPPDHTRIRQVVAKAFTPDTISQMAGRITAITHDLLDPLRDAKTFDLIADFAFPLSVNVIAEMLGVPPADRTQFRSRFRDIISALDLTRTDTNIRHAATVAQVLEDYFRDLAADHRARPRDNLLNALVQARDDGSEMSEEELIGNCILLVYAGHEATSHLIGNGLLVLLRHPDQWSILQQDPSLTDMAVAEILRYDSPQQMAFRYALEDVEIEGVCIRKGQTVSFGLAAANRDPAAFPDPDRFDITRKPNKHLAFGAGIHTCIGLPLARTEGRIALKALLQRMPSLQIRSLERLDSIMVRGLRKLEVTW
jgi:cytochrome P450